MTSPIGKILLTKLPKDIIQYCIEPYLMISKEQVKNNYKKVVSYLWTKSIDQYYDLEIVPGGLRIWTPLSEDVDACQKWRRMFFKMQREQRRERRESEATWSCCTVM